jgi:pimeloyl-ACP methyl ester carboxylesterase
MREGDMRRVDVNGTTLAVHDIGSGPAVVLLHGFPELSYSWRHQVPALVDAGYRVIVPDQRGYGASDVPEAVDEYSLELLVGDVVGLLDRLDAPTATIVGHDWGSIVAHTAALTHPKRFDRVVSLNVAYRGACWGFPSIGFIREHLADRFSYVLMFQEPGVAEAGFTADPEAWLNAFYLGGSRGRVFLDTDELATYVDAFRGTGISGAVGWYRNIDANAARYEHLKNAPITQPSLLLAADGDPVLPLSLADGVERWSPDIDVVVIDDCGHWTQQEQPAAVNDALIGWLAS